MRTRLEAIESRRIMGISRPEDIELLVKVAKAAFYCSYPWQANHPSFQPMTDHMNEKCLHDMRESLAPLLAPEAEDEFSEETRGVKKLLRKEKR